MQLEVVRASVAQELKAVENKIFQHLESDIPLVHTVMEHVMQGGGKRIRPLLVLLAAKSLDYSGDDHIHLAAVIEMIHTATLLHDDVVDESTFRRHQESANSRFGNPASVLIGDFLYARAFQRVVDLKNPQILDSFASATHAMAEGEILQLTQAHQARTTSADYFSIIEKKTAKLFSLSTEIGGLIATSDVAQIAALKNYGLALGLSFQLVDDALDYHPSSSEVGKNIQQDLLEGKMTLPLIYAHQQSDAEQKQFLESVIQEREGNLLPMTRILALIESTGAIQYTLDTATQYAQQARAYLSGLPESDAKMALIQLTQFVIDRAY